MVKRICIIFPDGSATVMTGQNGEAAALAQARRECAMFNRGERDKGQMAQFGEIAIDLVSFRERF